MKIIWFLLLTFDLTTTTQLAVQSCCPTDQYFSNGTCELLSKKTSSLIIDDLFFNSQIHVNDRISPFSCKDGSATIITSNVTKVNDLISKVTQTGFDGCIFKDPNDKIGVYECGHAKSCILDGSERRLCLPKCCEAGQLLSISETKVGCVQSDLEWTPAIFKNVWTAVDRLPTVQWNISPPRTLCSEGILYFQTPYLHYPKNLFRVMEDGRVIHKERSHWLEIPTGAFCLEGIFPQNGSKVNDLVYRCFETDMEEHIYEGFSTSVEYKLGITVGCYISAVFVLLTIIVYLLLWEVQNIHGWTLLCSFISLFSLYVHLGFMQGYHVIWGTDANNRNFFCWLIGVGLHFSYLSFFSWASVVNFDLWFTFRNMRAVHQTKRKWRRFLKYAVAGFGIPVAITGLSVSFDFVYRGDELAEYVFPDPDYGSDKCFLARNESPIAYWLGPIGSLLTVNIIFIVVTISSVYKAQKTASIAVTNSSRRHKQSLKLFGKLLVVMGVLWVFDIVSFVFSRDFVPWYFAIFDVINVCHGIFIFIIFVCKKSTLRLLEAKYPHIARMSYTVGKWWKSSRNCCTYIPNQLRTIYTQRSRRVSAESRRSTQSDHPTELSTV